MKNLVIITIAVIFALSAFSQTRVVVPKEMRETGSIKVPAVLETTNFSTIPLNSKPSLEEYESEIIGNTFYDLQSNASVQNRMFLFPDGFIGGTFTLGFDIPSFSNDRGTGYNSFDGYDWGPWPTQRIESDRCGWPSYAPWNSDGEIVVAHYSGASKEGLVFSKRSTKGTGAWAEFDYMGPDGHSLLWPRMVTSGPNHETIHVIAITMPVANGGSIYQGQDGALVYSRSTDGGETWDIENVVIAGLGSASYTGFEADIYEFAYPTANSLALLVGNDWTDLILMKSTDSGDTWTKTVIWEHPYPLFDPNNLTPTDTFYCADGSHSVAIDNSGKVHVAFGINRALCDGTGIYWFPLIDGVGYWNEDMPTFSNNLNALSPYGDPNSELVEDYNLLGWMQDINGNGTLDIMDDIGTYYMGPSSMTQLVIDDANHIFLVYSSVTETYDNGSQSYRHLWARGSNNNGLTWGGFVHLNQDLIFIFDECVFPSCSPTSDDYLHFVYQADNEPGMAVRGDEDPFGENYIRYYKIEKSDIITIVPGGNLEGIVTDLSTGLPIENAMVSLSGTFFSDITNGNGYFYISNIPAADYTAICSKIGYLNASFDVTIVTNITTTLDFELEEAIGLEPPQNLIATLFDQNNIYLDWDPPISGTPIGYNIYRNNGIIEFCIITEAYDYSLVPGTYEYFVTAVYDDGESLPSNIVEVTSNEPLLPPENLIAIVDDNDVMLTWDEPGSGGSNGEWIQWDTGENTGNGIGLTSGGTFYVASHWEPDDLANYNGMIITEISFFPNEDPSAIYELMVWTGPNAETLIMTQPITAYVIDDFNMVILSTPIVIDASEDLWFGFAVTHQLGTFPAGHDDGPAVLGYGDMISLDGVTWQSASIWSFEFNWNLAAYVEDTKENEIVNVSIQKNTAENQQFKGFQSSFEIGVNNPKKVFAVADSKDLLYYNIYRDNILIDDTDQTYYNDLDLEPDEYEYCITSVYDEGESDCSETVIATILEPCNPPENVTATVVNITEIELAWDPPAPGGTVLGYNLYHSGGLIDFVTSLSYQVIGYGPGTYEFCVSTVCVAGESMWDCADPVTIILLPPENMEAEISGSDIILTWDSPEEKEINGYNVYHNFENGNFNLFSYVTQTTSIYTDAEIGLHKFYVATMYDVGESIPSDTVDVLITIISENTSNDIAIYPNPASKFVNIESEQRIESVKVYNHIGEIVTDEIINSNIHKLNTSGYSAGLYFFQISTKNRIFSKRVIIK